MSFAAILALISTASSTAQMAVATFQKLRPMVEELFSKGAITAEEQQQLWDYMAAEESKIATENRPPHWRVEHE